MQEGVCEPAWRRARNLEVRGMSDTYKTISLSSVLQYAVNVCAENPISERKQRSGRPRDLLLHLFRIV